MARTRTAPWDYNKHFWTSFPTFGHCPKCGVICWMEKLGKTTRFYCETCGWIKIDPEEERQAELDRQSIISQARGGF